MKFIIQRELILKPLQKISNIISGKNFLPILNNVLIKVKKKYIKLIRTNLEIEIIIKIISCKIYKSGTTTVLARKFFDICRSFPELSIINIEIKNLRLIISSNKTKFYLSITSENNFPKLEIYTYDLQFFIPINLLKNLIKSTQFSMSKNDIRYYLNGMLFEFSKNKIKSVTTDGHRLSISNMFIEGIKFNKSIIIPRDSIKELMKFLDNKKDFLNIKISNNNIFFKIGNYSLISKLIEGIYPDYKNICLKQYDNFLQADCNKLYEAISRVSLLSNEKFKGIRLYISKNQIKITANNSSHEEAEEFLNILYEGNNIEICFNAIYILDVLNILKCDKIKLLFNNNFSGIQIENFLNKGSIYILMPMHL
ncbi:DNA polymerase III subunit beta [Sodalis-like secondary symbiont of Drepanosiphum platanoidis]|uniref:DNA polymerase III subunit beta n=1 Tax=Sodalis-like secondary symbiont of Drepanosiphum platanoidis TaxID=2994493 RepID=UPI003464B700